MLNKIIKTNTLNTVGSDNKTYVIYEYTTFIDSTTIHDTNQQLTKGLVTYKLANGQAVNKHENHFEIVTTGLKLKVTP